MKANTKLNTSIGIKATRAAFFINGNFDLLISKSKDPSKTIRIKPTVPNMGNTEARLGIANPKKRLICLTPTPKSNNNITDGIFVFEEVISKKYAKSNNTQREIIIVLLI